MFLLLTCYLTLRSYSHTLTFQGAFVKNIGSSYDWKPQILAASSHCLNSHLVLHRCRASLQIFLSWLCLQCHFSSPLFNHCFRRCCLCHISIITSSLALLSFPECSFTAMTYWHPNLMFYHLWSFVQASVLRDGFTNSWFNNLSIAWNFNNPNLAFEFLPSHSTTYHCLSFICHLELPGLCQHLFPNQPAICSLTIHSLLTPTTNSHVLF